MYPIPADVVCKKDVHSHRCKNEDEEDQLQEDHQLLLTLQQRVTGVSAVLQTAAYTSMLGLLELLQHLHWSKEVQV